MDRIFSLFLFMPTEYLLYTSLCVFDHIFFVLLNLRRFLFLLTSFTDGVVFFSKCMWESYWWSKFGYLYSFLHSFKYPTFICYLCSFKTIFLRKILQKYIIYWDYLFLVCNLREVEMKDRIKEVGAKNEIFYLDFLQNTDPLSLIFTTLYFLRVPNQMIRLCQRLSIEFQHYVIEARALRKVFCSIKGYYFQADIKVIDSPLFFSSKKWTSRNNVDLMVKSNVQLKPAVLA